MAGKPGSGRKRSVVLPMDEVRKLAADGWCLRQLADKYGCSRQCMLERMREAGIPRLPAWSQPGSRNGQWRGGRQTDSDGYILVWIPDHPNATSSGCVREHRLVMEMKLGRYLSRTEVVHHIDGNVANNDPGNLELFETNAEHLRQTLKGKCPNWTDDGKRKIEEALQIAAAINRGSKRPRKAVSA